MPDGFAHRRIATSGAEIHAAVGGDGPPLLLLHGFPQTHVMWHRVAPALAERFTVVAADLRGYGASEKLAGDPAHVRHSKRAMAQDQVEVMRALGFERFAVCGHDRGARVAHRMALDHPDRVERLAVIDIVPTVEVFERMDSAMATAYYHWFFLIQPGGLPEHLIGLDPEFFLRRTLGSWGSGAGAFAQEAFAAYLHAMRNPATVHAMCEDYRAAASIDLEHDRGDRLAGRRVACPTLVLWGADSIVGRGYADPLELWRPYAPAAIGRALSGGHFLPEERPEETLADVLAFFGGNPG
ncbi:alpha/beta fold hydrolase [Azospirillum halopraeferens]|uniref:alpha/beta fold hydrolase n=1 Tax=Azospirillum halopraeferens TaxID=34010 RepID=UPI00042A555E|nr:alpha/beta hydrolase [Azospirillum halopraeferens]